jgi:hypothetical protein
VQDSLDEGRDLRFRVKREESSEGELNHRLHRLHGFDSSAIETAGRLGEFRVLIGVDELTTPPKNRQLTTPTDCQQRFLEHGLGPKGQERCA